MATIKLPYVHTYTDVRGKRRCYYRRKGRRYPLPGSPGSTEFMTAYVDAEACFGEGPIVERKPRAGTLEAVIQSYYASSGYLSLRPATKNTYRGIIERVRAEHGSKRVAHLERRHVADIVAAKFKDGGPSAANNFLRVLRMLCNHAIEVGELDHNPTFNVRKIRSGSEGFVTWDEDAIARYEKRWPIGTRERLAFALLLYTGQRRGDVVTMGRQHVADGVLTISQSKTGATVSIPLHSELKKAIDQTPNEQLTFIVTKHGAPYTPSGFGNAFRDWCNQAGITKLTAHGLRKAAARRLAEAGCSVHQIAAITGHRTLKEVERYAAKADQIRLARDAMKTLSEREVANMPKKSG